jgi:hypothetical protein
MAFLQKEFVHQAILLRRENVRAEIQVVAVIVNEFERKHAKASVPRSEFERKPMARLEKRRVMRNPEDRSSFGIHVRIRDVRRIETFAVILALLLTPLVLLAQSESGGAGCDRMCCLPDGPHAAPIERAGRAAAINNDMTCHHGVAGHRMTCQMRANHSGSFVGPVAPIPPTLVSAGGRLVAPVGARDLLADNLEKTSSGFSSLPLEPPRS